MVLSDSRAERGTLECYRKVCRRKLGQYSFAGLRCNCGKTIKPAFQIAKNKVKVVASQSTSINLGASGSSLQHLISSSDLGKYPAAATGTASISYGTNNPPAREYFNQPTSKTEERFLYQQFPPSGDGGHFRKQALKAPAATVPKQKYEKLDNLLGSSYQNRKRGLPMGMTMQNMQNSAYSRAEKILQQQQKPESLITSSMRDPYSGLKKQPFAPPQSGTGQPFDFSSTRPSYDGHLNRSTQIDDILADRMGQGHIVDNVMNFFRYKDPERYGQVLPLQNRPPDALQLPAPGPAIDPASSYGDHNFNNYNVGMQQQTFHSRRQSSTQKLETITTTDSVLHPVNKKTHTQINLSRVHQGGQLTQAKKAAEKVPPALHELKVSGASQPIGRRIASNAAPTNKKGAAKGSTQRQELVVAQVVNGGGKKT